MGITHTTPLLASLDKIQLAITYAWSANDPGSQYYEQTRDKREQYLSDLHKACAEFIALHNSR